MMCIRGRKGFRAALLSALTAGSLGVAGGPLAARAGAASPVNFTYWTSGLSPTEISTIDSAFNAANPGYKVSGSYIAKSDEFLPKVIAALKTGTQPTVVMDQQPYDLPLYEESGKLIPLTGKLTALTNQLYPGIRASLFYRGQQLGMALSGVGDIALFYNKADFAKAGIKSPPRTWAELTADAVKLTDPAAKRWGFYVPMGDAEWISYDWEPVLWGDGGSLVNASETKATWDSAAGVEALSTWVNLIHKYKAAPATSFAAGGNFDGPTAFSSNAVAMITDGPWLEGEVPSNLDYAVAPYPAGSKGPSTNIGLGVAALFRTTPAEDQAGLAFIKFLASPKWGAYLADQSGGLPDSPAQLGQPLLKKAESNKWYHVFAEEERFGQVRPLNPEWAAASEDLYTEINDALAGQVSPGKALATAAKEADSVLSKTG
jgi:ABC-type glycerol-3-phosphate transport system substrate-binding protein